MKNRRRISTVDNGWNTWKSPEDLQRLAVTQTSVKKTSVFSQYEKNWKE